ncbi:MAG TPA: tRNA lysidine(34) synthetase TilS, partial [Acetobacteraceae bacterium]
MADDLTGVFDAAMARLGPFEPRPRLAAAVSGGADSMALAVLTDSWVGRQGGSLLAIIIDHGLRREAAAEAAVTRERLLARGIAVQVCRLDGLAHGPALAERARQARFAALTRTCRDAGILHLLLGHHAGDQAETVMMRVLRGSGSRGLAGMAALQESDQLRLLRPLLDVAPGRLRTFLYAAGLDWVEDPSNRDVAALRPRLRLLRGDPSGEGEGTRAVCAAARSAGLRRAADDGAVAAVLAARVVFRPDGVALLSPGPIRPDALAAVIQTIAGAPYPADPAAVAALAARPRPATIGGVRLMPARRLTDGMLVVREAAAMSGPVPAEPGAVWDRRFRLAACGISQGPVADWAGAGQSDAGQSD